MVAGVLCALLVAGCSAGAATSAPTAQPSAGASPGQGTDSTRLDGRTFLSTSIDGRALVPGSRVRLSFDGGGIGASAGCNSMGGPYAVADGKLVVGQLAMTEMACDPALMSQDTWLAGFLDGASVSLAGDALGLAKDGVTLTLLDRDVADPDRPLVGTRWVVDGLVLGEAVSSVPQGIVASVVFTDAEASVATGCNSGAASVEIAETTLTFGPLALTKMACPADAMEVEHAIAATLGGTVTYTIEADVLTLDAGGSGLVLRAGP